ncbi:potassium channel family protein [Salinirussus salinus]|jgi:trk system potassium uptake protein TrkA|uniref:potassium channel family protein n=1 Tax=Salinirussus salinus TaxID=1198300 RepID=UPI00135ACBA6|nr:TrkA family potassium uptake protein [Salinirussus salinus]
MKLVIVGFGRVGRRTARTLRSEGHEVVIVERDAARADRAREDGFSVVTGDGGDEAVLAEAGLDDADAVAGLTGDVNTNYSACLVAASHGCRTVLRVGEDLSDELYEKYAGDVDEIIYPERLGAVGAKTALMGGDFNVIADLTEHLSLASVAIPEGSPAVGRRVVGLDLPGDVRVYAHGRADEDMRIPLPKTTVRPGDRLAVMAAPDQLDAVREALRG